MSTIQNLKNFIRHGKQARAGNAGHADPSTSVSPVHASPQRHRDNYAPANQPAISEPNLGAHKAQQAMPPQHDGYSVANVDHRNIAAQAGGAAANAAGQNQKLQNGGRRHDDEIAKIVAEERESKSKLPRYPGLERYILVEKMGDGAFSNVYRAKDTSGQWGEVAIKVVRKFEMNSNQVCNIMQPSLP